MICKQKPRRNAVYNSSFELNRNRWDPLDGFRLPVKACRPPPEPRSRHWFTYGSRTWFLNTNMAGLNRSSNSHSKDHAPVRPHNLKRLTGELSARDKLFSSENSCRERRNRPALKSDAGALKKSDTDRVNFTCPRSRQFHGFSRTRTNHTSARRSGC